MVCTFVLLSPSHVFVIKVLYLDLKLDKEHITELSNVHSAKDDFHVEQHSLDR